MQTSFSWGFWISNGLSPECSGLGVSVFFETSFSNLRCVGTPEMVRTSDKTVAPVRPVLQAPVLVEVSISGALFFGSFLLDEQKK
jgi:hypothetical protein